MKQFKIIDFWVSIGLIIGYTIIYLLASKQSIWNNVNLIQGYFVVGTWQVLSMLIHTIVKKNKPLLFVRNIYHGIVLVCMLAMPLGYLIFGLLLYAAPFMAIFYTALCGYENFLTLKNK